MTAPGAITAGVDCVLLPLISRSMSTTVGCGTSPSRSTNPFRTADSPMATRRDTPSSSWTVCRTTMRASSDAPWILPTLPTMEYPDSASSPHVRNVATVKMPREGYGRAVCSRLLPTMESNAPTGRASGSVSVSRATSHSGALARILSAQTRRQARRCTCGAPRIRMLTLGLLRTPVGSALERLVFRDALAQRDALEGVNEFHVVHPAPRVVPALRNPHQILRSPNERLPIGCHRFDPFGVLVGEIANSGIDRQSLE